MKARCLNPNTAYYCGLIRSKSDGMLSPHLVFSHNEALRYYNSIYGSDLGPSMMQRNTCSIPCGKCAACQIRKRKEMTVRLTNETSVADECCFITLTYNDDNVPVTCCNKVNGDRPKLLDRGVSELPLQTLLVSDVQKFMKRLRRHLSYVPKRKNDNRDHRDSIRYFVVGEYGGKYGRPHYHLLIFGWKPSDLQYWQSRNGVIMYRSPQIEKLWKYGFSSVEEVGAGCARYCSRYVTKKFARLNKHDIFDDCVFPEFCLQSVKNGGIGAPWFDRNIDSIFRLGYINLKFGPNYVKYSIPKYYWNRCRQKNPCLFLSLKNECIRFARSTPSMEDFQDLVRKCELYAHTERVLSQQELF